MSLPGHAWLLHLDSWVGSPGQGRPPLLGGGLLQSRTRVLSPPPQEEEHPPHPCHKLQFPSTAIHDKNRGFHNSQVVVNAWNKTKKVWYWLTRTVCSATFLHLWIGSSTSSPTMRRSRVVTGPVAPHLTSVACLAAAAPATPLSPVTIDWQTVKIEK